MQMTFWVKGEKYILHLEFDSKRIYEESLLVYTSTRPASLYKRVYQPESDHTKVNFGNNAGIKKADQRYHWKYDQQLYGNGRLRTVERSYFKT